MSEAVTMPRLDYDRVAHLYDEPIRDHPVDRHLVRFLEQSPGLATGPVRVLDVGCGTGKQLVANREHLPDVWMTGVDRSRKMLRLARARGPHISWVQADGTSLPLRDRTIDYATSQFSYHHVGHPPRLLGEVFRVLAPGGRFVMTNIDPWAMTGWLVYRYFPEALALDRQDYLRAEPFETLMREVGFVNVRVRRADLSKEESVREFLHYASSRHRASQFMAIADAAYAAGLRRIEHDLSMASEGDLRLRSEFVLVTVTGDRPSASE